MPAASCVRPAAVSRVAAVPASAAAAAAASGHGLRLLSVGAAPQRLAAEPEPVRMHDRVRRRPGDRGVLAARARLHRSGADRELGRNESAQNTRGPRHRARHRNRRAAQFGCGNE